MNRYDLKPCPFCGELPSFGIRDVEALPHEDKVTGVVAHFRYKVAYYCHNCLAATPKRNVMAIGTMIYEIGNITAVPFKMRDGIAEARDAWNRRANV